MPERRAIKREQRARGIGGRATVCQSRCCGRCTYRLRAIGCSPGDAEWCGAAPEVFVCPEAQCEKGGPIGPGAVLSILGHCYIVQAGHFYDCAGGHPVPPTDPAGLCLPTGAVLVDDAVFACVDCQDKVCAPFQGYYLCRPCPNQNAEPVPAVMRCRDVFTARNAGCACPSGCVAKLGDPGTAVCVYPDGAIIQEPPPGAVIVEPPFACSCCACRGGQLPNHTFRCINSPTREPECNAWVLGYERHCPPEPDDDRPRYLNDCCCDCRGASGTFSGTAVNTARLPGHTCDCSPCGRTVVRDGRWDANGYSYVLEVFACIDGRLQRIFVSNPSHTWSFAERQTCPACSPEFFLNILIGAIGNATDCSSGLTGSRSVRCFSANLDMHDIENDYSYTVTLSPNSAACGGGCGPVVTGRFPAPLGGGPGGGVRAPLGIGRYL